MGVGLWSSWSLVVIENLDGENEAPIWRAEFTVDSYAGSEFDS